jgi:hypothetical protein
MKDSDFGKFPFYAAMTEADKALLRGKTMPREIGKGQIMTGDNHRCTGIPLVMKGRLRLFRISERGREMTLYRIAEGEMCILAAVCALGETEYDFTIEAEKDSALAIMPPDIYKELLYRSDEFRTYVFNRTMARCYAAGHCSSLFFSRACWKKAGISPPHMAAPRVNAALAPTYGSLRPARDCHGRLPRFSACRLCLVSTSATRKYTPATRSRCLPPPRRTADHRLRALRMCGRSHLEATVIGQVDDVNLVEPFRGTGGNHLFFGDQDCDVGHARLAVSPAVAAQGGTAIRIEVVRHDACAVRAGKGNQASPVLGCRVRVVDDDRLTPGERVLHECELARIAVPGVRKVVFAHVLMG